MNKIAVIVAFVLGVGCGGIAPAVLSRSTLAGEAAIPPNTKPIDIETLKTDVEKLKGIVTDQSHVMADIAYHYSNLWYAAKHENWPLAQFYVDEVRSHLRWAVRVIPVRKNVNGIEVKLADVLGPIEAGNLEALRKIIDARDKSQFENAYRQMIGSCYTCHLIVGKPFLRLNVPEYPESPIIDMRPAKE